LAVPTGWRCTGEPSPHGCGSVAAARRWTTPCVPTMPGSWRTSCAKPCRRCRR
jgi:hypothetical protein